MGTEFWNGAEAAHRRVMMKAAGLVESGVEAKEVIQQGLVMVDGEIETRRGRKLYDGAVVQFDDMTIHIEK